LTSHSPSSPDALAQIRHDLRTPVNQILGYSEMLQEDAEAAGQTSFVPDLQKIQFAARQLQTLITDTLGATSQIPQTRSTTPSTAEDDSFPSSPPIPLHGRVLVVDDIPANLELLTRRLERHGLEVETASNGRHALDILRTTPFDLVLLDVQMPVMDGHTALLHIKADPLTRHIPVIMISALDELDSVIRCIEAGAEDYLPKPCNPTLLRTRIGVCLERKSLADSSRSYLQSLEETQQRLQKELSEASRYVRSILPAPLHEPFRIDWEHQSSSEIGGDAFGYHWIDPDHFAIYLLDVCGHGVAASLLSVSAINVIRSGALPETDFRDPSAVLSSLNAAFPMERQNNMYFTIWYGVHHAPSRTLRHASGGHPPALLLEGHTITRLHAQGMMIGVMPESSFPSESCHIPEGSSLFVLSDGCYEIRSPLGGMLTFEEFETFLRQRGQSESILAELLQWVRKKQGNEHLQDDFSIVRIRF
jgi:sigma-B regulation protein RsbU (phosphoserine phosphatase)